MRKPRAILAIAVLVAAVAALVVVPALAASSKTVTLKNLAFTPKKLTVKKGTKITWAWKDGSIPHNVTVTKGPVKFHSKTQSKGTFSEKLTKPGTYQIVCTIHVAEGMKMTIVVK